MNSNTKTVNWGFKQQYVEQGFTLSSLAERSGIHPTYLSLYARGRYRLTGDELDRLAALLNTSVDRISQ
jgi:transcriptional regulator with XRE-family HTH domain